MCTATAIRTGVVLAVAVVLGLMVAPAAQALWSVLLPINAGTIQAANFSVQLTGSPSKTTQEMTLANGSPATVELIGSGSDLSKLYPGASITAGVQVANTTNAGSDLTIRITVPFTPEITLALAPHLTVSYATAGSLAQCATATYGAMGQLLPIDVAKGDSAVVCFQIALSPETPSGMLGTTASVKVPLQANQIGRNR